MNPAFVSLLLFAAQTQVANWPIYIGYTHKSHIANELAVIPVSSLEIKP